MLLKILDVLFQIFVFCVIFGIFGFCFYYINLLIKGTNVRGGSTFLDDLNKS